VIIWGACALTVAVLLLMDFGAVSSRLRGLEQASDTQLLRALRSAALTVLGWVLVLALLAWWFLVL
jgi:hypothetical protein